MTRIKKQMHLTYFLKNKFIPAGVAFRTKKFLLLKTRYRKDCSIFQH